jgi:hypothetical protein
VGGRAPAADRFARRGPLKLPEVHAEPAGVFARLPHMDTLRRPGGRLRSLGLGLALLIGPLLAGCSSAVGVPASATPSDPPPSAGSSGSFDPAGRIVIPKPGQLDVHPLSASSLSATVEGRRVVVTVHFASGIEPCSILDSIVVAPGVGTFAITLREGHGPGNVVCIMIAEFKRAIVDLGTLAPGTYTISDATGGATAITVVVS